MSEHKPLGYEFDLHIQLETTIETFEQARESHWKGTKDWSETQELFHRAEELSRTLLQQTGELAVADTGPRDSDFVSERWAYFNQLSEQRRQLLTELRRKVPPETFKAIEKAFPPPSPDVSRRPPPDTILALVWERFCIDLARQAVTEIVPSANRLLQIIALVIEAEPTAPTADFLHHVSRCYIAGFDAECVILCRGAIDAAFRGAVSDELCNKLGKKPDPRYGFTMSQRIEVALQAQLIEKPAYDAARAVNERGTKSAHYDLNVTKDVIGTIRDTLKVIRGLTARN